MWYVGQPEPPNFQPDFTHSEAVDAEDVSVAITVSSKSLGKLNGRTNAKLTACPANQSKNNCQVWDVAMERELRRLARREVRQDARTTSRVTRTIATSPLWKRHVRGWIPR